MSDFTDAFRGPHDLDGQPTKDEYAAFVEPPAVRVPMRVGVPLYTRGHITVIFEATERGPGRLAIYEGDKIRAMGISLGNEDVRAVYKVEIKGDGDPQVAEGSGPWVARWLSPAIPPAPIDADKASPTEE